METHSARIGSLLVKEGFITPDDVKRALEIQRQDAEVAKMPLSAILLKKGLLSEDGIYKLMRHSEIQKYIGSLLLKNKVADTHQLEDCFREKTNEETIGDVLLRKGILASESIDCILENDFDELNLAKLALRLGMITEPDLEAALKSKRYRRALGEILCDLNLITLSELNLVFQKYNKRLKLGEILLQQEIIDKASLEKALQEQNTIGETLGKILVRKALITIDQLYFALSVQYNIPFHNLDGFVFYGKQIIILRNIIAKKYAEQYLAIPLFLNGKNLTVAISNPSRIWVVDSLKSLYPQFFISCVLITEEKFEQLFVFLYGELLDVDKSTELTEEGQKSSNIKLAISDCETDSQLVDQLYESYARFKKQLNEVSQPSESQLFRQFILHSYKEISEKFGCTTVSFSIELRNKQIEILAAPLVEYHEAVESRLSVVRCI